jgi:hypothetical protein
MAAVFAMQGIGQLTAAFIMLFVTLGFKQSLLTASSYAKCTGVCAIAVDKMWRTLIGFGAVPGCIALYFVSLSRPWHSQSFCDPSRLTVLFSVLLSPKLLVTPSTLPAMLRRPPSMSRLIDPVPSVKVRPTRSHVSKLANKPKPKSLSPKPALGISCAIILSSRTFSSSSGLPVRGSCLMLHTTVSV